MESKLNLLSICTSKTCEFNSELKRDIYQVITLEKVINKQQCR